MFKSGKKSNAVVDHFGYNLQLEIGNLSKQLANKSYKHGYYKTVFIQEKKRRDLAVATVLDRVVHRFLYDYLVSIFDKSFDADVWSSRKAKGLHKCLSRTQATLEEYKHSYVWRSDITKFFDNVDHVVLCGILERKLKDDDIAMYLCKEIIKSYKSQEPRAKSQEPRAKSQEPRAKSQEPRGFLLAI